MADPINAPVARRVSIRSFAGESTQYTQGHVDDVSILRLEQSAAALSQHGSDIGEDQRKVERDGSGPHICAAAKPLLLVLQRPSELRATLAPRWGSARGAAVAIVRRMQQQRSPRRELRARKAVHSKVDHLIVRERLPLHRVLGRGLVEQHRGRAFAKDLADGSRFVTCRR